jgi:hypothetical protein
MYEQILPWVGLGVLFILCLPISPVQKLVLEVSAWTLRLGMIGLLAAGAYLWFRPGDLPAEVSAALSDFPRLVSWLPDRSAPPFGLCLACIAVTALVPVLAVLDVSRKLGGRRLGRLRELAAAPVAQTHSEPAPPVERVPVGVPVLRPIERRTAAQTIASAAPPARSAH